MPIIKCAREVKGYDIPIYVDVAVTPPPPGSRDYFRDQRRAVDLMDSARDVVEDGLELARGCAARVVACLEQMAEQVKPSEFEVQLGITLGGEVGAVVARSTAEAQMVVTMRWKGNPEQ